MKFNLILTDNENSQLIVFQYLDTNKVFLIHLMKFLSLEKHFCCFLEKIAGHNDVISHCLFISCIRLLPSQTIIEPLTSPPEV